MQGEVATTSSELAELKRRCIDIYNKSRSVGEAARRAIAAATQDNSPYAGDVSVKGKVRAVPSQYRRFPASEVSSGGSVPGHCESLST
jgi:hypothetical protein